MRYLTLLLNILVTALNDTFIYDITYNECDNNFTERTTDTCFTVNDFLRLCDTELIVSDYLEDFEISILNTNYNVDLEFYEAQKN